MVATLPRQVNKIIQILQGSGYEAYAVGGCVRDLFLGKEPTDWDITTSAKPEEVKALFHHTIDTGLAHGTVTVMWDHVGYEVTTYRIDGEYEDGRHPKQVEFTSQLSADLARRDFTINAMAYNDKDGLVDLFGGQEDLERGLIRCVGNPEERFSEDALRMLRALRFSAQLGFSIDENTYAAIHALAPTIAKISKERIMAEMNKLLVSNHPEIMRDVYETGLTAVFFPEFDAMMECEQHNIHHCYTVGEHTIVSLSFVPADKNLRLTMLLHDVGKPACKTTDADGEDHFKGHAVVGAELAGKILHRLKYDNATIDTVKRYVRYHDERPTLTERGVRRAMARMGTECFPEIFLIRRADTMAQSDYYREEKLQKIEKFEEMYHQILEKNQCFQKKDLAINGRDLIDLGLKQGSAIGDLLEVLFEEVIEEPEKNTREYLLQRATEYIAGNSIPKR